MSDQTFTHSSADGLTITARLRLNPIHSAIVNLLSPDERPLVTLEVANNGDASRTLRVALGVDRYSDEVVDTLTLDAGSNQSMEYLPTFDTERLATLNELTKASVRIRIDDLDAGKPVLEKTLPLHLLALNSAPLASRDPASGDYVDQTRYLGAFVTPNDAEIDAFLEQATRFLPKGETFAGYAAGVTMQVKALYEALAERGTQYVDSTLDFNPDAAAQSTQRVRLPKQALTTKLANCLDGTLLFASLLERIKIQPAIVIIPGHALVAWATTASGKRWQFLETTELGKQPFEKAEEIGKNFAEGAQRAQAQAGEAGYYRLWPLSELRAQGITPISKMEGDEAGRIARALEVMSEKEAQPGSGGITIGEIHAVNVGETQTIDQRGATFNMGDRNVNADKIENSTIQTGDHAVNTGGGAYIGGSVTTGGNFIGRDQIVGGQQASPDANKAFTQLAAGIALKASSANVDKAMQLVTDMQAALARGDDDTVADCINELAALVPDAKDVLVQAFSKPPLSQQVGPVAKYFLERMK